MFDVLIIGSGLGGLLCATFLAKEGMKVCVVEKNRQPGGNLQTFSRKKQLFDTGVHYIGGLQEGQTLHRIFTYAGLIPGLKLQKMDEAFDIIMLEDDEAQYAQSQGWPAFQERLIKDFPKEQHAIAAYCKMIKETCAVFPLYHLQNDGDGSEKIAYTSQSAKAVIESLTSEKKLQAVLAGNNLLYAGSDKTPFHVHALIINSYVESSWKCTEGGSQIVKLLIRQIRKYGGEVIRNKAVTKLVENNGLIVNAVLEDDSIIRTKYFISNISPAATLPLTNSSLIKKHFRNRIESLSNTPSSFSLYITLKEKAIPYQNRNFYYHKKDGVWTSGDYHFNEWPLSYGLYFTEDKKNPGYASALSVLTLMQFKDVEPWAETLNTTRFEAQRGAAYEAFKKERSEKLLQLVYERFPEFEDAISEYDAATPLTNRDYIGMEDGSIYGIQKDYKNSVKTMISPRTKIPNLFLTGQNVNLHGILGTSLTAILTCTMLLEDDALIDKIRNA